MQQDPHEARKPGPQHRQLEVFCGRWKIEGRNAPVAPASQGAAVSGEVTYEWLPGRFFLTGRWDHRFAGGGEHQGLSVMGQDPESGSLVSDNFDNLGYHRQYVLDVDGRLWRFSGRWERAVLGFEQDGRAFTLRWEITRDGVAWGPLCELRGTRIG